MFVRIFLLPLFGPLGDRVPRKWLALAGDAWRGLLSLVVAVLALGHHFQLALVMAIYILLAAGSALFNCAAGSMITQLVPPEELRAAMQQGQAITSLGSIVGALAIGGLLRRVLADRVIVAGVALIGLGIVLLPWLPNALLPLAMMFAVGIGSMMANIPLGTQITLAMPDEFRARAGSLLGFITQIATPLGTAFAGLLISGVGLSRTMAISGGALFLASPLLYAIPEFSRFFRLPPAEAATFFRERYPRAFEET